MSRLSWWKPLVTTRTYSLVTDQGTAMSEATLCARHYSDPTLRAFAELVAWGAEDFGDLAWRESTGNEAVACVECKGEPS